MTEAAKKTIPTRKGRSLEDEIARQETKLKRLHSDLKEKKRRDQERNARAISTLLQSEGLDQVPVETWQQRLPELRTLLLGTANAEASASPDQSPGNG
ncbi:MAG: hypothetical protein JWR07_1808 [Nevskia sp.]|nr:hypothetical protein [Nevskia sp.]